MSILILLAVCFLAYSNGANDNFKGVASLLGSKTTTYSKALRWATVTTLLGSACSFFLASSLLAKFSGKGLVPDSLTTSENFLFAVAFGAGATVILATFTGFPISTTHGLTGAIVGAGLVAVGSEVSFLALQKSFLLPLLLSPLLAVAAGAIVYGIGHFSRLKTGVTSETCLCVGTEFVPLIRGGEALATQNLTLTVDKTQNCIERYQGNFFGTSAQNAIDYGHYLSAGTVCFARGLNDTPKIVALLLVVQAINLRFGWVLVALAMALGGIINAKKVAEKMSYQITKMNSGQAFSANLATGFLVIVASFFGLPVSTTHVSVGSLFGVGLVTKQADIATVSTILLSWVITLPCAAMIAGLIFLAIS